MKTDVRDLIKKNLIRFTGLPKETVEKYLAREESIPTHIDEWNFWNPQTNEEISWFYVCSRTYLFASAIHVMPKNLYYEIKPKSIVIDFGGGAGYVAIPLAKEKDCVVYYFDLNLIQREFIKYVANKYSLQIELIDYDEKFMPLINKNLKVDFIFALDVFEHIPNYPEYVSILSDVMKRDSKMYVIAPFDSKEPSHINDKYGLEEVCRKNGLIKMKNSGKMLTFLKR